MYCYSKKEALLRERKELQYIISSSDLVEAQRQRIEMQLDKPRKYYSGLKKGFQSLRLANHKVHRVGKSPKKPARKTVFMNLPTEIRHRILASTALVNDSSIVRVDCSSVYPYRLPYFQNSTRKLLRVPNRAFQEDVHYVLFSHNLLDLTGNIHEVLWFLKLNKPFLQYCRRLVLSLERPDDTRIDSHVLIDGLDLEASKIYASRIPWYCETKSMSELNEFTKMHLPLSRMTLYFHTYGAVDRTFELDYGERNRVFFQAFSYTRVVCSDIEDSAIDEKCSNHPSNSSWVNRVNIYRGGDEIPIYSFAVQDFLLHGERDFVKCQSTWDMKKLYTKHVMKDLCVLLEAQRNWEIEYAGKKKKKPKRRFHRTPKERFLRATAVMIDFSEHILGGIVYYAWKICSRRSRYS